MNEESKGNSAGNESEVNHIEAKHPHKDDSLNLKPVEIVVVENMNMNMNSVKSVQQLVKTVKDVERRIILNVCVNLCKQLRCKQLQQLQTEARWTEQIQRDISSAREISKETSRKTKTAICEYVNWI